MQGAVTPIDAVVSAATGVTMGYRVTEVLLADHEVTGVFVDGHRVTEVVWSLRLFSAASLLARNGGAPETWNRGYIISEFHIIMSARALMRLRARPG